jgi:hypothetical protein
MGSGGFPSGFDVINRNRINGSSHTCRRLDDCSDGRGILRERMTKLEKLAFLCHPNPSRSPHRVLQLSLPLNQAKSFV